MDFLSPDGIMKLTIDTLDDERTAGRFPAIVRRHFYYELINRPSADLVTEIESEYGVQWCPVLVNEMGDGHQRLYSIIEMRNVVRWPDLINIWRAEIVKKPVSNATFESAKKALTNDQSSKLTPAQQRIPPDDPQQRLLPEMMMIRTFATSTPKNHRERSTNQSTSAKYLTPSQSGKSNSSSPTEKTKIPASWSPSPIRNHNAHLLSDEDDNLFNLIDEKTASGQTNPTGPMVIIPMTSLNESHTVMSKEHSAIKRQAQRHDGNDHAPLKYQKQEKKSEAERPDGAKKSENSYDSDIVTSDDDERIPKDTNRSTTIRRDGTNKISESKRFIEESELTDSEEELMQMALRLDQCRWAETVLHGKRTTRKLAALATLCDDKNECNTPSQLGIDDAGRANNGKTEPSRTSTRKEETSNQAQGNEEAEDDATEGIQNDTTVSTDKGSSFEIEDERVVTLDELLTQLKDATDQQPTPKERDEKANLEAEKRRIEYENLRRESEESSREAATELAKTEKRAILKKALANCERFSSIDASDIPPPFEITGIKRYVINASHRDYLYIMGRVTGIREPNLYMRRQLGDSGSNQHGYYILTRDMNLFEAAKRTEKGAVAIRIPSPNNDQEVLFFVRIVEPQKISDRVYKQWGQATREERISRHKLPGQRFYITVHTEPTIDLMLDPIEIDTHEKFLVAVRRQLTSPERATKYNQLTDLSNKTTQGTRRCTDKTHASNKDENNGSKQTVTGPNVSGLYTNTSSSQVRNSSNGAVTQTATPLPHQAPSQQPAQTLKHQEEQRQRANRLRLQKSTSSRPASRGPAGDRHPNRRL